MSILCIQSGFEEEIPVRSFCVSGDPPPTKLRLTDPVDIVAVGPVGPVSPAIPVDPVSPGPVGPSGP